MKDITAIIRPEKLDAVRDAIDKIGHAGVTIIDCDGHGKQKGVNQTWRGETFRVELLPKIMLKVVVQDSLADRAIKTIMEAAKTGQEGDGKIFVTSLDAVYRIRTAEVGEAALR